MAFLVALVALIAERFFHWRHLRHWGWFSQYERWLNKRIGSWSSIAILSAISLPLLLAAIVVNCLLAGWFYGVFQFLFSLVVVVYCLGPDNLWLETSVPATNIFIAANERIFAVLFWFVLLGPAGAILYRLMESISGQAISGASVATKIKQGLDWLPVRLITFLFALAGHFMPVFRYWQRNLLTGIQDNEKLLMESGELALENPNTQEALELIDRVFIIGLVILALLVLVI